MYMYAFVYHIVSIMLELCFFRGIKIAQSSSNAALKMECAEILEGLKVCYTNSLAQLVS